jgi:acyl-CoA thioester hydrolase
VGHRFNHLVIYQDTDAEGVVYYANYLGYFERGRMELLRSMGFPMKKLKQDFGIVFAIRKVECDYLAPAMLEDEITIETEITEHTMATVNFYQKALRGEQLLVAAKIQACSIDINKFRPVRIPQKLIDKL